LVACATSPLGRSQLILFPDSEMAARGTAAYNDLQTHGKRSNDAAATNFVLCVANAIIAALPPEQRAQRWEVTLFEEESANAFALPGGKIGVHTGMLRVARTQDQLAAVLAHEVGHVIARHANERMSTGAVAQMGTAVAVQTIAGSMSPAKAQMVGALGGIGLEYGVLLPFSRTQEAEADLIGLELMARAGFDPHAAVDLWRNMSAQGGAQPPEFMSTHPSNATRIAELGRRVDSVMPIYEQARAAGRRPHCQR